MNIDIRLSMLYAQEYNLIRDNGGYDLTDEKTNSVLKVEC